MKPVFVVNIALLLVATVLLMVNVSPAFTGGSITSLENSDATCAYSEDGVLATLPKEQCCYEAVKQYACEKDDGGYRCYASPESSRFLVLDQDMMTLCQKRGYDVG
ncbi:hypothetical protein COV20_02765 [Candidatus Woesearchaeota archaeon CG10_big_fil_rev_8_21_14_0_10_45_16]|nr:MAG: hypothetical protein COV20_02765 [Candidatus Woesearchaeota archaeon CG10_big_fil_rev_8_21_14_0_10_45_16]